MTSAWTAAADLLDPQPSPYLADPTSWVHDRGGGFAYSLQREILESVRGNRYTAVKSCHAAGKSYIAAQAVAWWVDTHEPGTATVVTTAPTADQVRRILWKEINRVHAHGQRRVGQLAGRTNQTEWLIGTEPIAFGRKPADYDQAAFQGIHEEYVLVIFDEADGIPQTLYDEAAGLMTTDLCRMLLIGNPYDPQSPFATACKPGSLYNVITISAFDTPNFTGEAIPDRLTRLLVTPTWVEERRAEWGEDSPLWHAKVLAEFPIDTADGVIPLSWIRRCQEVDWADAAQRVQVALGVDPAAGGDDQTVIRCRRGNRAAEVWRVSSADPKVVCDAVVHAAVETGATRINVDSIGWGWGLAGMLELALPRIAVNYVNVAETSREPERFMRLRDELWWMGRENSQARAWDLTDIDDRTVSDLTSVKYSIGVGGRVKVEPKDDTRKRLGRSPDDADALLLAFHEPDRLVEATDIMVVEGDWTPKGLRVVEAWSVTPTESWVVWVGIDDNWKQTPVVYGELHLPGGGLHDHAGTVKKARAVPVEWGVLDAGSQAATRQAAMILGADGMNVSPVAQARETRFSLVAELVAARVQRAKGSAGVRVARSCRGVVTALRNARWDDQSPGWVDAVGLALATCPPVPVDHVHNVEEYVRKHPQDAAGWVRYQDEHDPEDDDGVELFGIVV